jgi:hypothetical protein
MPVPTPMTYNSRRWPASSSESGADRLPPQRHLLTHRVADHGRMSWMERTRQLRANGGRHCAGWTDDRGLPVGAPVARQHFVGIIDNGHHGVSSPSGQSGGSERSMMASAGDTSIRSGRSGLSHHRLPHADTTACRDNGDFEPHASHRGVAPPTPGGVDVTVGLVVALGSR